MTNNYSHLNNEQREIIQHMINTKYSLTKIGKTIGKDRTTIAKEIKRNRYYKGVITNDAFDKKTIAYTVSSCSKLQKCPYVCNGCLSKGRCGKGKLYYHSNVADKNYHSKLHIVRQGIDITEKELDNIEHIIVPLIKHKKHSINQVFINHNNLLNMSKTTFYKYVDLGILSLTNMDLPKKITYKKRKRKYDINHRKQTKALINRTYNDFTSFVSKHPTMSIVEMDTVIGKRSENKVLLTLTIRKTNFVIIRLLNKNNIENVNKALNKIKKDIGKEYKRVFRIILTDNGSEFLNPEDIEKDIITNNKIINLFYCDPYSSYQKSTCEKNHEYIRKVFPKKTSFESFNDSIVQRLQDNINNVPRKSLNNKTPYDLTKELFPEFIEKINSNYISPDEVSLSKEDILGNNNE